LYGCETWSLILWEEYRLGVLRRIFGPKREELADGKGKGKSCPYAVSTAP